jgi:hypothetical protein
MTMKHILVSTITIRRILFFLILLLPNVVLGADICVGPSSSGDGTGVDWNNIGKWSIITFVRGNSYYLQSGTYGPKTFGTAEDGNGTYINIKKATSSAHGPANGWQDSYASGPAHFEMDSSSISWTITTGYWDFDGVTGYFKGETESYGIELQASTTYTSGSLILLSETFDSSHLIFRHIKLYSTKASSSMARAFDFSQTAGTFSNFLVQYCYINEIALPFYLLASVGSNATDITIEYSVMRNNYSNTVTSHSEGIVARSVNNLIVRYTWWESIFGTGVIAYNSSPIQNASGWEIYGNVIFVTNTKLSDPEWQGVMGLIVDGNGNPINSSKVYNNTVYNYLDGMSSNPSLFYSQSNSSNNEVRNNLYYHSTDSFYYANGGTGNVCSHEYRNATTWSGMDNFKCTSSQTATGNPFVSVIEGSENFQLTAATLAGYTLASPYNQDCSGKLLKGPTAPCVTRGADGVWDRGAFEYGFAISPPTNIRIILP